MTNKIIDNIKVGLICIICLLALFITLGVIVFSSVYSENIREKKIVNWLLKNVTIQTVIEDDKWIQEYPYEYSFGEIYKKKIDSFEKSIQNFCTTSFPFSETINDFVVAIKSRMYHYKIDEISSVAESNNYVDEPIRNVLEFQSDLGNLGYPFLYVQTPSLATIQYDKGAILEGDDQKIAERSYSLTNGLKDRGINLINISKEYDQKIMFDCSSHWFPQNALECAQMIARELNNTYGFNIDLNIYSDSFFYNLMSEYEFGRKEINKNCGYDFIVPVPVKPYRYELIYAEESFWKGDFVSTMLNDSTEWNLESGAYHNIFRISNSLIFEINNYDAADDKEILIIGDSFNWPVSSYLSLGIKKVTVIHNASFTGSLISYVKQMNPDLIVMIYNDAELYEIYTNDAFYLE